MPETLPDNRRLASRRSHGLGAAFPSPDSVGTGRMGALAAFHDQPIGAGQTRHELARQREVVGLVASIAPETVRCLLTPHQLKSWRHQAWLSPHTSHDAAFYVRVTDLVDLDACPLDDAEIVLCVDEKTAPHPRPRSHAITPAHLGLPNRLEHES